jgi:hypothetical protein
MFVDEYDSLTAALYGILVPSISSLAASNGAADTAPYRFEILGFGEPIEGGGALGPTPDLPVNVFIDVKPGSDENPINLKSKGVLPVSIISTPAFDAADVDVNGLLFGDPVLISGGALPVSPIRSALEDVTGDGLPDLNLKYSIAELVSAGVLGPLSEQLQFTGSTSDGMGIVGSDVIRIISHRASGASSRLAHVGVVPEPTAWTLLLLFAFMASASKRKSYNFR